MAATIIAERTVNTSGPEPSAVSWAAVLAGAFVTAATALMLVALGAGVGLSSVSPWPGSGVTAGTFYQKRFIHTGDLRTVAAGGTALDPDVVQLMLTRADTARDRLDRLTPRQREVLALVAQGRSNAAIAHRLSITDKAVVAHISRIYTELDIPEDDEDHRRVLAVIRYLNT